MMLKPFIIYLGTSESSSVVAESSSSGVVAESSSSVVVTESSSSGVVLYHSPVFTLKHCPTTCCGI